MNILYKRVTYSASFFLTDARAFRLREFKRFDKIPSYKDWLVEVRKEVKQTMGGECSLTHWNIDRQIF